MNENFELLVMPGASQATENRPIQAMATQTKEDRFFTASSAGGQSDSGEVVNPTTALGHGPVWQAVNILAGDVGQLPFWKMRKSGDSTGKDRGHPLNYALTVEPNPWQNPSVWKETMMSHALLWGNGISVIQRLPGGGVWFMPLMPDVTFYAEVSPGEFWITTRISNKEKAFPYEDCFHVRGLQSNGFWGMSAVDVARNVLGHGLALQAHGNRTFKNDARPSGVLRTDSPFNADAHKNLRQEWYDTQGGDNRRSIAILWEGLQFQPMSVSNEDSQWLEARKLDREFVASLFNLPAFKLNALENSAVRSNLEEQNRDYFQTSLSRWTNRFAEEARRKLLTRELRASGDHWFRWFPEAFLRGDIEKRMKSYSLAIASRILNPNEARAREDLDPYEGGDEYINPAISQAGQNEAAQQAKAVAMVEEQVHAILDIEANRVERAAATSKNFVAWAERFYSEFCTICEDRLTTPCELAELLGVTTDWRSTCENYTRDSLQELLSITEVVTQSGLSKAGTDRAKAIREQAKELTRAILSGVNHG